MRTYVTFGQIHRHEINNQVYDKDCVAVMHCEDAAEGRDLAFRYFGPKFCFEYHEKPPEMKYFPRGFITAHNPNSLKGDCLVCGQDHQRGIPCPIGEAT